MGYIGLKGLHWKVKSKCLKAYTLVNLILNLAHRLYSNFHLSNTNTFKQQPTVYNSFVNLLKTNMSHILVFLNNSIQKRYYKLTCWEDCLSLVYYTVKLLVIQNKILSNL